jgi:hypothetical protein
MPAVTVSGCKVHRTGPREPRQTNGPVLTRIELSHDTWPAPNPRWFDAHASLRKEMLATALTALAFNLTVTANLSSTDADSTINRLYVGAP